MHTDHRLTCSQCGYDLAGIPPDPGGSVACPECRGVSYPDTSPPPTPRTFAGLLAAPMTVPIAFCGFAVLLGYLDPMARKLGLTFVAMVFSPAAVLVGIALANSEYRRVPAYCRRWWHRPAIYAACVLANAAIALAAIRLV